MRARMRRVYSSEFTRGSPTPANAAEEKTGRARVHDAVRAATGLDARVAQIFEVQENFEIRSEGSAHPEIGHDPLAEPQRVLVILELTSDPANARCKRETARRPP